ncbi:hypothetical protein B0T19DRAFT_434449 [Cercophora scortea]|uniref:Short-chain dehydrogenase/reductase n=1 Tax=Cercophora scortea TaxID=314031 RepID=A0AAE0I254_9PEZI|nr:hypothetical protein B0T19DRAFT_434449 [Cercophora scortea]
MGLFGGGVSFNAARDIPSLKGKVILVTGGNSGLGKQSILDLSKHEPTAVWLAARGLSRAQAAADDIIKAVPGANIIPLDLDLASFDSIKAAARRFTAESPRLDILMLNAGIMAVPAGLTASGYEIQFGVNHVGHALFFKLLTPLLLQTASTTPDVRVISLTSVGHTLAPTGGILFDSLKTTQENLTTFSRYGQSKLANALFARELARRYPQLKAVAIHPGGVSTNLANTLASTNFVMRGLGALASVLMTSVETGVKNQLWGATAPADKIESGAYYAPVGKKGGNALAHDDKLAAKLWEWTEKELEGQEL